MLNQDFFGLDLASMSMFREHQNLNCLNLSIKSFTVNGGFSEWSLWSPCTVTCGGGERIQTRTCTNPRPEHGGYYCFGIDSKKDACNSHFCPGTLK